MLVCTALSVFFLLTCSGCLRISGIVKAAAQELQASLDELLSHEARLVQQRQSTAMEAIGELERLKVPFRDCGRNSLGLGKKRTSARAVAVHALWASGSGMLVGHDHRSCVQVERGVLQHQIQKARAQAEVCLCRV